MNVSLLFLVTLRLLFRPNMSDSASSGFMRYVRGIPANDINNKQRMFQVRFSLISGLFCLFAFTYSSLSPSSPRTLTPT